MKLLLGEDVTIHLSAHELEHFDALMTSRRAAIKQGVTDDAGGKEVIVNFAQSVTIDKQNNKGYSALMWASEYGHKEVAELLLDKGAQVDLPSANGSTSMIMASRKGHKEVVELLFDRGAKVEVELRGGAKSALAAASRNRHKEVSVLLPDRSAPLGVEGQLRRLRTDYGERGG